ncbi:MAG: hypothetical protein ACTFAL_10305 [Candidatus Electronema sp. V4]|uniref:hypothetical protein n=1 Tax=Candidatus Electronema sp. V4 TaxID=3454756 RepID=UPI0040556C1E
MCFLRKLFGRRTKQAVPPVERPPRPADWHFTFADLMAKMKAGKRNSVGQPEMDWARDYERSLIPAEMRFPQKGDVYEVLEDMEVEFMTAWAAPFTGGGKGMLRQGERVIVHFEPAEAKPIGAYAKAVEYKVVENRMVPVNERTSRKYGGFYFYFSTVELNTKFALVRRK